MAGPVGDLIVVGSSGRAVLEQSGELGEQFLPVAGDVLHPQVIQDEALTSRGRQRGREWYI